MTPEAMFDAYELYEYASANSLEYVWEGTTAYAKRLRILQPDQYIIRPVRTRRGITHALLFASTRAREDRSNPLLANAEGREGCD